LTAAEFSAFLTLIAQAQARVELPMLAACLMPNHFHLVVSPRRTNDISRWMQWLLTTHSHRHHLQHGTTGRVWQGRFKAFPIEQDRHLLTVMRYVERKDWLDRVNAPQTAEELADLRACVNRQRPYGDDAWVKTATVALGLESSLRHRGRPRKSSRAEVPGGAEPTRAKSSDRKKRMAPIF